MGKDQYGPLGASAVAKNRLFTEQEHKRIVEELVSGNSKLGVVFAK